MTKAERLAALDLQFESPTNRALGQMQIGDYCARRAVISAEPDDPPPAPAPKPQPRSSPDVVSHKTFSRLMTEILDPMIEHARQLHERVVESDRRAAARIEALESRVAELERQVGERASDERRLKAV